MDIHITPQPTAFLRVSINYRDVSPGTCFHLARWRPGRYEAANYTKYIRRVSCHDNQGNTVKITKKNFYTWIAHPGNTDDLSITYEYYANQLDAGGSYCDQDICYLNFLNFVMYRISDINNPHEIRISLPDNFQCGTSLKKIGVQHYSASSFYELADSPFLSSGNMAHLEYSTHGTPFHIWIHNPGTFDEENLINDFKGFTREQISTMGHFPSSQYHFLIIAYPERLYHGVEHGSSTVICLGPTEQLFNERYNDLLGISSHELFHVWNIIHVRPAPLTPYKYTEIPVFDTGFVAEGFTTYLGDLFLVRSKVRNHEWYYRELEKLFQRHYDNPGRLNTSLSNSSIDLWADGYQPAAPARKGSIYVEGAVLALMLDLKIRLATNDKTSILTLMTELCKRFGGDGPGYYASDIIQLAVEISGDQNLPDFFDKYLYGKEDSFPLMCGLLSEFGLSLKSESNPDTLLRNFGIRSAVTNGFKIRQIAPESPSSQVLRQGDEILEIDGQSASAEVADKITGRVELKILRHGQEITIELNEDENEYFPIYKLVENPSQQGKKRLGNWLKITN